MNDEAREPGAERSALGRYPFPWVPDGWFAVALESELSPGGALPVRALARDLVLHRRGGDERWAVDRGAPERILPVCSCDGVLFVWHHARGEAPSWSVPVRRDARWSPIVTGSIEARHHVQELAENTVDATHGVLIHGFLEPTKIRSGRVEGPFWKIVWDLAIRRSYEPDVEDLQMPEIGGLVDGTLLDRPPKEAGAEGEEPLRTTLDITCCGLGMIDTVNTLPGLGWPHLVRFCITPLDEPWIRYLVIVSALAPEGTDPEMVAELDRRSLAVALRDTRQDAFIFERKRYLQRPAITRREAALMTVRRWARQFYSGVQE